MPPLLLGKGNNASPATDQALAVIDLSDRGGARARDRTFTPGRRGCAAAMRGVPILQARVSSDRKETQMRG